MLKAANFKYGVKFRRNHTSDATANLNALFPYEHNSNLPEVVNKTQQRV